jgi:hypothetical protein
MLQLDRSSALHRGSSIGAMRGSSVACSWVASSSVPQPAAMASTKATATLRIGIEQNQ